MKFHLRPVPHFVKEGFIENSALAAYTKFCYIKLDCKKATNCSYEHELVHVKQWWLVTLVSFLLFGCVFAAFTPLPYPWLFAAGMSVSPFALMYRFIESFKVEMECMAYAKSYHCDIERMGLSKAQERLKDRLPVIVSVYDLKHYSQKELSEKIHHWYMTFYS